MANTKTNKTNKDVAQSSVLNLFTVADKPAISSKLPIYRKKSATKVQSKFAKEKVVRYRQEVGELIRLNLLKTTQSSLLKTTIDDEQMTATAVPDTQVRQPLPSRITPKPNDEPTE